MKVLVTGAAGFIGSHVVEALLNLGHEVRALVRYTSHGGIGFLEEVPENLRDQLEVVRGDILDSRWIERVCIGCDSLVHLAALIGIPYSYDAPAQYIDVNVKGTHNVLSGALKGQLSRVVVFSTSEVYGTAQVVPITEDHVRQPQSPYSASKIAADALAMSYHLSFDLPLVIARPFNTYGPRQSERAFIPAVIAQLMLPGKSIKVGDLTPTRDLVFVKDTASCVVDILESDTLFGLDVNISTGIEHSIGSIVEFLRDEIDPSKEIVRDPSRLRPENSEVFRLIGDNERLIQNIGRAPKTTIEAGLRETIDWFRARYVKGEYRLTRSYMK